MLDSTPAALRSGETPLLQTVGLTKCYGNFLANDAIDIEIRPEQIHANLGALGLAARLTPAERDRLRAIGVRNQCGP